MFLALDQGTTSSRSILFSDDGQILACAQEEIPQIFPEPGWVEQDLERIWQSQLATARRALSEAGVHAREVKAIGIANQRETVALWARKTGRPAANAIVWQDRRTADVCERLKADGWEETIQQKTGLVIDPYFSATKIQWLNQHVGDGDWCVGTIDAFLLFRLTNGRLHATDVTNASRTMLFNIHSIRWDEQLCRLFGVKAEQLPTPLPSDSCFGVTAAEHFGAEIPICGVVGDQQAAAFGQGCTSPGSLKNTYGTGSFLLANIGGKPLRSRHKLLTTLAWQTSQETAYAFEGSVFVAGSAIQWLRDGLGIIQRSDEIEALAASVGDSGGVCFVPAFAGLGAPYWDAYAKGALTGLTRGTGKAHIARAALEAVCLQTLDVVEAMQADCPVPLNELRVDGGMAVNDLLMQMQADVLGLPVVRPSLAETTAFGAAKMAGMPGALEAGRVFEPKATDAWRAELKDRWRDAVHRTRTY